MVNKTSNGMIGNNFIRSLAVAMESSFFHSQISGGRTRSGPFSALWKARKTKQEYELGGDRRGFGKMRQVSSVN